MTRPKYGVPFCESIIRIKFQISSYHFVSEIVLYSAAIQRGYRVIWLFRKTHPWIWDIMSVVSTGLALPCPVALGTMLCSLVARVSAFAPSDTEWKNCWINLLPLEKKIPTKWKQAFIGLGSGMSPNWRQVIAWNKDDPVVDTGLLHMYIIN